MSQGDRALPKQEAKCSSSVDSLAGSSTSEWPFIENKHENESIDKTSIEKNQKNEDGMGEGQCLD
jgi:hypothetical protein